MADGQEELKEGKQNHQGEGGGNKPITEQEKNTIVSQLEPYLKSGLNISKSLGEAGVSRSTFYRLMKEDEKFRDKINQYRNFVSILANNLAIRELMSISTKQAGNPDKNLPPQDLDNSDREFLWKFLLNSNLTKGEYGERTKIEVVDPEAEIHRVEDLIESRTSKTIKHDD